MNRRTLGRRGALSGGLAVTLAAPRNGRAALARQGAGGADDDHAPFRSAFLDWLHGASGRLALPISADTASPSCTPLRIQGVHPAINISLRGDGEFSAWVGWDGVWWDSWLWLDVYEKPAPGG